MKRICLVLLTPVVLNAQLGWIKITTPTNPIISDLSSNGVYRGAAWVDVDNDGLIDLFTNNKAIFKNLGSGNFTIFPTIIGQTNLQSVGGSSWADLDNDGDIDCLLAHYPTGVYLNNGDGTFANATSTIDSLTNYSAWGGSIGNMDNDAFPDFVLAHAGGFHGGPPHCARLYKQNGPTFNPVDKYGYAFTDSVKPYTVPYWSDFDMDGDMDLFIASGPAGSAAYDYCYRNMKKELNIDTLYRMLNTQFTIDKQDGQCYNFIDYDNDGDLDLCLTNYNGAHTRLYKNTAGTYSSIAAPFTGTAVNNLSNSWADFDNDGDQDVIITSDNGPTKYYKNNGDGTFNFEGGGLTAPAFATGVSSGDYDNDGDLDVYLHGGNGAKSLFQNDTVAGNRNWINIKLIGNPSNKSALGAFVRIKANIYNTTYSQLREVNAQNSFQSQNDLRVHFGLGNANTIDSLIIKWPSGNVQTFSNVSASMFYSLTEGGSLTVIASLKSVNKNTIEGVSFFPNPAKDYIYVSHNKNNSAIDHYDLMDVNGRLVVQFSGKDTKLDVTKLESGVYYMRVMENGRLHTAKIVIE